MGWVLGGSWEFTKLMDDEGFDRDVKEYLLRRVYRRLNAPFTSKPSG